MIDAERDEPERAATRLGQVDRLRSDARAAIPRFQQDDVARARETLTAVLGPAGFLAAFEQGKRGDAVMPTS